MNKLLGYLKEIVPYIIVIIIVLFIKMNIFTPIRVNGPSMNDTLYDKDIMILDEVSYKFNNIKRFDIVVLKYNNELLIKRVIGLPGETVRVDNNKLYINGKYIKEEFKHKYTNKLNDIKVEDNCYFVMGDNRLNSADSRIIGCIPRKNIIGKTSLVIFPFNRIGNKN